MQAKVAGLIYRKVAEDLAEKSGGSVMEVATGAQILKAKNILIEGETAVTVVMGASVISMTPSTISIAGTSIKLDGEVADEGALIVDN
jgi:type VI secretion system secreted protein VgrG